MIVYAITILNLIGSIFFGGYYLKVLRKRSIGQEIREEGPEMHLSKAGTPTMGGLIFVLPTIVFSLLSLYFVHEKSTVLIVLITFIGYAFIGGIDDYFKVVNKRNLGLTSLQKILLQIIFFGISYVILCVTQNDTTVNFFFTTVDLRWIFPIFALCIIVGSSNATNITDGLDGLLGTNAILTIFFFIVVTIIQTKQGTTFENDGVRMMYLQLLPGLLVFLMYNRYPAKVFMGDTGSLALGAMFAMTALILKIEIAFFIAAFLYVFETVSVILQVMYFKLTKGKRIFKMAPIHHHFEYSNWSETKIVRVFSLITLCASCIGSILIYLFY